MQLFDFRALPCLVYHTFCRFIRPPVAEMRREALKLLDIQVVLSDLILPLVEARDLAALACTSTELKHVVYDQHCVRLWEAAARYPAVELFFSMCCRSLRYSAACP